MFKDITKESVKAFKKLTQDYSDIDEALLEREFQFLKNVDSPLKDAATILGKITGFAQNCPLCKAIDTNCDKCIYSLHNKDNESDLHCVDLVNKNHVHYTAILQSHSGKELKTALDNKVKFMKKFLIKYEAKMKRTQTSNILYLADYNRRLVIELAKKSRNKDTIKWLKAKIKELKAKIK